ncbi:hypothetical protein A9Q84_16440 [Halobacteriovorax marinus]|uniref:N-acetyltransferase domain-containing protein n=1 Tax=Halobacteriovorax marinus TaxID=97084 RepID=A0A1Y5F8B1_9BACT|nr:hypothetical protein A9Q84_16440 [Halobacteriovorax marinus]
MKEIIAKDGSTFFIRPITSEDKNLLIEGLDKLSEESKHHRFLGFKKAFTEKELKYLTELDGINQVGLALGFENEDSSVEGIGVARYHRLKDNYSRAEFAITLLDNMQGKGLGTQLMLELILNAKSNGVTHFEGLLETTNEQMIALVKKLEGFTFSNIGNGLLKIEGDLSSY